MDYLSQNRRLERFCRIWVIFAAVPIVLLELVSLVYVVVR